MAGRQQAGHAVPSTLARLVASVAILVYLASRIDMATSARALAAVRLSYVLAALALVAADRAVMILRWFLLLRARDLAVTWREAARIFLVSSFVGSFLPAGIGADAARAYGLIHLAGGGEAVASVTVDRALGILSLIATGAAGLVLWAPGRAGDWRLAAAVLLLAAASIAVFWADQIARIAVPRRRRDGRVVRQLLRLSDAIGRYRGHRGALVHVMAWSLVVQALRVAQAFLLARGLDLLVPFGYLVMVMPLGFLMLMLPVSVSGFGLPQGVIVWLLHPLGVADSASFALSTLIVLAGIAGNLPGLVLWLSQKSRTI